MTNKIYPWWQVVPNLIIHILFLDRDNYIAEDERKSMAIMDLSAILNIEDMD